MWWSIFHWNLGDVDWVISYTSSRRAYKGYHEFLSTEYITEILILKLLYEVRSALPFLFWSDMLFIFFFVYSGSLLKRENLAGSDNVKRVGTPMKNKCIIK